MRRLNQQERAKCQQALELVGQNELTSAQTEIQKQTVVEEPKLEATFSFSEWLEA